MTGKWHWYWIMKGKNEMFLLSWAFLRGVCYFFHCKLVFFILALQYNYCCTTEQKKSISSQLKQHATSAKNKITYKTITLFTLWHNKWIIKQKICWYAKKKNSQWNSSDTMCELINIFKNKNKTTAYFFRQMNQQVWMQPNILDEEQLSSTPTSHSWVPVLCSSVF